MNLKESLYILQDYKPNLIYSVGNHNARERRLSGLDKLRKSLVALDAIPILQRDIEGIRNTVPLFETGSDFLLVDNASYDKFLVFFIL